MNHLIKTLADLRKNKSKALSLFVTAGYPALDVTVPLITELAHAGADLIEIGIPFSDPIADGPMIQLTSERALHNGVTLQKVMQYVCTLKKQVSIPIILMGYANPIFNLGIDAFLSQCRDNGVDGTIVPDLTLEEGTTYRAKAASHDVASILLAAPTTSIARLHKLDECSTGFLYCVSVTGVTGARSGLSEQAAAFLQLARREVQKNPLLIGFGISTPVDASAIAQYGDGVIIGSALMKLLHDHSGNGAIDHAVKYVRSVRETLDALQKL